jgi:hypothetical protein
MATEEEAIDFVPRPRNLRGLRIGLVENTKKNVEEVLRKLAEKLDAAHGMTSMKWFWPGLAIAVFLIVDRVYADGRGADELFSILQWVGSSIRHWSDDLLRPLGR